MIDLSHGGRLIGGALLVAGTAIGGGMLALPVLTAAGGALPAIVIYLLCWAFMCATGLLFLEVLLWCPEEINIVSMAKMTLGTPGKIAAWILYIFMFYSLSIAYMSGGGGLVAALIERLTETSLSPWLGPLLFVAIFAPFVAIGPKLVDRINSVLMIGLILSFLFVVVIGFDEIESVFLKRMDWPLAFLATPVMFTSFAYQGIVPTLTNYLDRHPRRVKWAIIIGSLIPLVCYTVWEILILGVVPLEQLEETRLLGLTAVAPLKNVLGHPWLFRIGEFFAFFAIITSFFGVTLGLLDFFADGLKIHKDWSGRLKLSTLVFGPPLAFSMINPRLFLFALQYAGGLGTALLLGLLPILMVWRGRYQLKFKSPFSLFGGRIVLSLLALFILFEFFTVIVYTAYR